MKTEIVVDGIPVVVVRKAIKHAHLRVSSPDGHVRVTIPWLASNETVRRVVAGRLEWIRHHQSRIAAQPPPLPRVKYTPAEARECRRQLALLVPPLIAKWQPIIGVSVAEWRVRQMKTRWGTCNIKARRMWLNLELANRPVRHLEFIVVHEMVHLLERNHNARFKAFMDRFLPDWRTCHNELKARGTDRILEA